MEKIEIKIKVQTNGQPTFKTVEAFGVGKYIAVNSDPGLPSNWTITHKQSGFSFLQDIRSRKLALLIAEELNRLLPQWSAYAWETTDPLGLLMATEQGKELCQLFNSILGAFRLLRREPAIPAMRSAFALIKNDVNSICKLNAKHYGLETEAA